MSFRSDLGLKLVTASWLNRRMIHECGARLWNGPQMPGFLLQARRGTHPICCIRSCKGRDQIPQLEFEIPAAWLFTDIGQIHLWPLKKKHILFHPFRACCYRPTSQSNVRLNVLGYHNSGSVFRHQPALPGLLLRIPSLPRVKLSRVCSPLLVIPLSV